MRNTRTTGTHKKTGGLLLATLLVAALPVIAEPRIYQARTIVGPPSGDLTSFAQDSLMADFTDGDTGKPVAIQTKALIGFDATRLYLTIECQEPAMDKLTASARGPNDAKLFNDDCVEVFISPSGTDKAYFHFAVNSSVGRYDAKTKDSSWGTDWSADTHRQTGGWTVQMTIPFAGLGEAQPTNAAWRINICRERRAGGKLELSSWSPTGKDFHCVAKFGWLIFGTDLRACLNSQIVVPWDRRMSGLRDLAASDTKMAADLAALGKELTSVRQAATAGAPQPAFVEFTRLLETGSAVLTKLDALEQAMAERNFDKTTDFNQYSFDLPPLPAATPDVGYRVYQNDLFELLDPKTPPAAEKARGQFATFACPGQFQPISFVVYSVKDLTGLKVEVSSLAGKDGAIPAGNAQVNYIKRCRERLLYSAPKKEVAVVDRFLERKACVDVPARHFQEIWVTVQVPEDAKPGVYTGTIRVLSSNAQPSSYALELEVMPFTLAPVPGKRYGVYYAVPTSQDRVNMELRDMKEHGATVIQAALCGSRKQAIIRYALTDAGKVEISWQRIERWLQTLRNVQFPAGPVCVGMNFGRLAIMLGHKDITLDLQTPNPGKGATLSGDKVFQQYAKEAIEGLVAIQKSYPEYELVLADLDEIEWGFIPVWLEFARAAHQVPGFRFYQTFSMSDPSFCSTAGEKELAQIASCTDIINGGSVRYWLTQGLSFEEAAAKVKSIGSEFWIYPNPGGARTVPKTYRLINGPYLWLLPISASVPYTYQICNGDPFNDADGYDFGFSFPSNEDGRPVATKSWEAYRQGIYDLQYLYKLETLIEARKAQAPAETKAAQDFLDDLRKTLSIRPEKTDPMATWLKQMTSDDWDRIRRQTAMWIVKLDTGGAGSDSGVPGWRRRVETWLKHMTSAGRNMIRRQTATRIIKPEAINAQAGGDSGLMGWWRFDEGNGHIAKDSSGMGNDGEIDGAVWTPGKRGTGLRFNSLNQSAVILSSNPAFYPTRAFTIELWFKPFPNSPEQEAYLMAFDYAWAPTSGMGFAMFMHGKPDHDALQFEAGNGSKRTCLVKKGVQLDTWHHCAATYDGQEVNLYLDGLPVSKSTLAPPVVYRNRIGGDFSFGDSRAKLGFDGVLDEIRLYNRPLTAKEVAAHCAEE